jgi:hypothetical protein
MALFEPKLTEHQRATIFELALNGARTCDLAKQFDVSKKTIQEIKYDPKRLAKAEAKMTAHQAYARLRIHRGAMKGIEKEHEILDREVPEGVKGTSLLYLQHQVATSMMDHDGLKAPEKSEGKIEVVFGDGTENFVPLGMPSDTTSVEEEAGEAIEE